MGAKYDIPDYGFFNVTLPDASSVFEDESVNGSSTKKVYRERTLRFLLTGPFGFDITAEYQKGGFGGSVVGGAVDAVSSVISSVGPTGVISQRSATLTYKNSKISGITLPFALISETDVASVTDDLDALYRAVLPTFGETGKYSVSENGIVNVVGNLMNNWGLITLDKSETLTDFISKEGGAITSRAANALNQASSTLNGYFGVYGQTAPLSYDPTILSSIEGTVGLSIGGYFECKKDLVITKVDVKFSQACDINGSPLYAEGNIFFSFVKPIDHRTFRGFFKKLNLNANVVDTVSGENSFVNVKAREQFKGLATNLKDIAFGK